VCMCIPTRRAFREDTIRHGKINTYETTCDHLHLQFLDGLVLEILADVEAVDRNNFILFKYPTSSAVSLALLAAVAWRSSLHAVFTGEYLGFDGSTTVMVGRGKTGTAYGGRKTDTGNGFVTQHGRTARSPAVIVKNPSDGPCTRDNVQTLQLYKNERPVRRRQTVRTRRKIKTIQNLEKQNPQTSKDRSLASTTIRLLYNTITTTTTTTTTYNNNNKY